MRRKETGLCDDAIGAEVGCRKTHIVMSIRDWLYGRLKRIVSKTTIRNAVWLRVDQGMNFIDGV